MPLGTPTIVFFCRGSWPVLFHFRRLPGEDAAGLFRCLRVLLSRWVQTGGGFFRFCYIHLPFPSDSPLALACFVRFPRLCSARDRAFFGFARASKRPSAGRRKWKRLLDLWSLFPRAMTLPAPIVRLSVIAPIFINFLPAFEFFAPRCFA